MWSYTTLWDNELKHFLRMPPAFLANLFLRRKFLMISLYIFLCKTLIPLRIWSNPTLRIMILTNISLYCMTLLPHNLLFLWPNGSWEGCFYRFFSIYSHEKVNLPLTYHLKWLHTACLADRVLKKIFIYILQCINSTPVSCGPTCILSPVPELSEKLQLFWCIGSWEEDV